MEAGSGGSSQEILERGGSDREIAEWVVSRSEILKFVIDLTRNDMEQDDTNVDQSVSRVISTCYIKNFQLLIPIYIAFKTLQDRIYKESRALFPRTRNGTPEPYEEFAARILKSTRAHPSVSAVAKKIGEVKTEQSNNDVAGFGETRII
jgi:hypothetical protein